MDYKMVAKGNNFTASPFKIGGTTANPSFAPDTGALVESVINNPDAIKGAVGFVEGLIKKK